MAPETASTLGLCSSRMAGMTRFARERYSSSSEAAEPEETPVTAPTVEVVQPEEKRTVPAWLKEVWQQLFPADAPDDSEPASSEEVLPTSETALPPEETETEPETEASSTDISVIFPF